MAMSAAGVAAVMTTPVIATVTGTTMPATEIVIATGMVHVTVTGIRTAHVTVTAIATIAIPVIRTAMETTVIRVTVPVRPVEPSRIPTVIATAMATVTARTGIRRRTLMCWWAAGTAMTGSTATAITAAISL